MYEMDATFGSGSISASDWAKGIALSILASVVGGASKLSIRKSWLLQHQNDHMDVGSISSQRGRRQRRRILPLNQEGHDDEGSSSSNDGLLAEECTAATATTTTLSNSTDQLQEDLLATEERDSELETDVDEQSFVCRCCCCCCCPSVSTHNSSRHQRCSSYPSWFPQTLRYSGMLGMSVLNPICCVLAMNYASPSILAPFSGLTLCWVILGSPCINNEQPSTRQILACALIITGEVVVAIFGDHTNDEGVTTEDVRKSYLEPAFLMYFFGLVAYVLLLGYWMYSSKTSPMLRRFAWGSCGGSITGAQNFLKDSLTILKDASAHHEALPWFFYLFLILAAGTAFSGLLVLTACMKRYYATYSAASFVGSFVVSASIMATAHYNTFAELEGLINYILYPTGLAVLMFGVYLLVRDIGEDSNEEVEGDVVNNFNDEDDKEVSEEIFGYTQVDEDSATREETVV